MFSKNLKILRNKKKLSQEALAIQLNVVRQTVSKWEKGLSVPDADMLIKIADILEVSVSTLLGSEVEEQPTVNEIAEQLAKVNEQLAIRNKRTKRIIKVVIGVIIAIFVINLLIVLSAIIAYSNPSSYTETITETVSEFIP